MVLLLLPIMKSSYRRTRRIIRFLISIWIVLPVVTVNYYYVNGSVSSSISSSVSSVQYQQRFLEEVVATNNDNDNDTFLYNDLSKYSIRYEKCQYVKMYDEELAETQSSSSSYQSQSTTSPLATKHFVVYSLCPSDTCTTNTGSSSSSTTSNSNVCGIDPNIPYGTYTMTVEDYLYYTINYQKQLLNEACNFCNAYCLSSTTTSSSSSYYCTNTDCTNTMCNTCSDTCDEYQYYLTAINNGNTNIVDAANYIQCQRLYINNNNNGDDNADNADEQNDNDEDDSSVKYYIGPYCQSVYTTSTDTAETSISIGLFSDENCYIPISSNTISISELMGGMTLSYHLFKHTTTTTSMNRVTNQNNYNINSMQCLSCFENNNQNDNNQNNNQNDINDIDDVNEMCENLYTRSAKCESIHGLQNGFIQMNRNNQNDNNNNQNNNQVENEFMTCTFIQSLLYNSYNEKGIINLNIQQDYIKRHITNKQQNVLLFLSILVCCILGMIQYYEKKIHLLQLQQQQNPSFINSSNNINQQQHTKQYHNKKSTMKNNATTLLIRNGEMS